MKVRVCRTSLTSSVQSGTTPHVAAAQAVERNVDVQGEAVHGIRA